MSKRVYKVTFDAEIDEHVLLTRDGSGQETGRIALGTTSDMRHLSNALKDLASAFDAFDAVDAINSDIIGKLRP